jgi:hypothetical protein
MPDISWEEKSLGNAEEMEILFFVFMFIGIVKDLH